MGQVKPRRMASATERYSRESRCPGISKMA